MTGADVFPPLRAQSQWTVSTPKIAIHESYWNGLRDGYIFGIVTVMIGGWVILRNRIL